MNDKTTFLSALRPFSLIVALATCGLGVSLALIEGYDDYVLSGLVLFTGILLQVVVNLINDYQDIHSVQYSSEQRLAIKRNTMVGWCLLLVVIVLGLYMVSIRGWPLLILGLIGVIGAWGYTGSPINYKQRGLGILLVFWFMGVLLIGGSYFVVSGKYHLGILWLSIPFSLLSSLLLLSNELRDYEDDLAAGIHTFCVRHGYNAGVYLYYSLVVLIFICCLMLYFSNILNGILVCMITLMALWRPIQLLGAPQSERQALTPLTGRFYFIFSVAFLATIWIPLP